MIDTYLALVKAAFEAATEANIDAVESFEAAHPEVVDLSYQAMGPAYYEIVTGTVHAA